MSDTADLVHRLLSVRTWRAFDVGADGHVLAGDDTSGTVQLVELAPDGSRRTLTALEGACSGRYLKGVEPRTVIVSHDTDGNERAQLSTLRSRRGRAPARRRDLQPLVRDPAAIHSLAEVLDGARVVYATNRRNGVDFDLVLRDLTTDAETVLYDGGGMVGGAAVAPDGSRALMTRPGGPAMSSQVLLLAGATTTEVTPADEPALYAGLQWLPDGSAALVTTDHGRDHTGIARLDVDSGAVEWLVTDDAHDVSARLSPDGRLLLVVTDDDGASRLAVHDAARCAPAGRGHPRRRGRRLPHAAPVVGRLRRARPHLDDPAIPADVVLVDAAPGAAASPPRRAGDSPVSSCAPRRARHPDARRRDVPCLVYAPRTRRGRAS